MVLSVGANKKRILAVILLVAVAAAAFFLIPRGEEKKTYPGLTNEERIAFLQSFGWQVEAEPVETREVAVPAEFSDIYTAYNEMQKAQGFDLAPLKGEPVTQYRYRVTNYPGVEGEVYATLLVREGVIVGGDVALDTADGFMHGFAADSARYEAPQTAGAAA